MFRLTEEETEFNFKDFKNHDIYCEKCHKSLGVSDVIGMQTCLCDDCFNEIEEKYKEKHPEEYE